MLEASVEKMSAQKRQRVNIGTCLAREDQVIRMRTWIILGDSRNRNPDLVVGRDVRFLERKTEDAALAKHLASATHLDNGLLLI